jgi:hypothetical protein
MRVDLRGQQSDPAVNAEVRNREYSEWQDLTALASGAEVDAIARDTDDSLGDDHIGNGEERNGDLKFVEHSEVVQCGVRWISCPTLSLKRCPFYSFSSPS